MADGTSFSKPIEEIVLFTGQNDGVFVWNAEDVHTLRTKHRIVGSLVGSLPRRPRQNVFLSLPLLLSKEETTLLLQKNFARLVKNEANPLLPTQDEVEEFNKVREESISGQIKLLREETEERGREFAEIIKAGKGKRKKRQRKRQHKDDNLKPPKIAKTEDDFKDMEDDEANLVEKMRSKSNNEIMGKDFAMKMDETQNVKDEIIMDISIKNDGDAEMMLPSKDLDYCVSLPSETPALSVEVESSQMEQACMIHLPTRMPKIKTKDLMTQKWNYPQTEIENLKYQVFLDLWEKGFYITTGSKFGGDFLAYPGDPIKFHSFYVVLVVPRTKKMKMLELISIGRLAATVKKTAVLGSVNEEGEVVYSSIKWSGIS